MLIRNEDASFPHGYTAITREGGPLFDTGDTGIDFGIRVFNANEKFEETSDKETAWLLMSGKAKIEFGGKTFELARTSLFDEPPSVVHLPAGAKISMESGDEPVEWALCRVSNPASFEPRCFLPKDVEYEYRGKGLVQEACLRNVRQVFDKKNRPESRMVLGEVVNFPGRWSSYPPHHHAQPEIYHYRFTMPQGYGHAEVGEAVHKVRQGDTVMIPGGMDHAQVSAPGYGMYYLWVVRHLEGSPYTGFEFTKDHEWLLNPENQGWKPKL